MRSHPSYPRRGLTLAKLQSPPTCQHVRKTLFELQKFYYETANTANPVAMGGLRRMVPLSQILFGSDHPYHESAIVAKGLTVSEVFNAKELLAVERGNAGRILPRLRTS